MSWFSGIMMFFPVLSHIGASLFFAKPRFSKLVTALIWLFYGALFMVLPADRPTLNFFITLCAHLVPRIHEVRHQVGQINVAANMAKLLEGSEIIDNCQKDRVQDAYALRCIPQLHGACRDAIAYVLDKAERELNAVTDNPLMFLEDEAVISGGNFHGEPMAIPFDTLGIAASELANSSERRLERMVNAALSNGLTPFLTVEGGVNSGYMIVQYAAASMVSENKIYAHPASVDISQQLEHSPSSLIPQDLRNDEVLSRA